MINHYLIAIILCLIGYCAGFIAAMLGSIRGNQTWAENGLMAQFVCGIVAVVMVVLVMVDKGGK